MASHHQSTVNPPAPSASEKVNQRNANNNDVVDFLDIKFRRAAPLATSRQMSAKKQQKKYFADASQSSSTLTPSKGYDVLSKRNMHHSTFHKVHHTTTTAQSQQKEAPSSSPALPASTLFYKIATVDHKRNAVLVHSGHFPAVVSGMAADSSRRVNRFVDPLSFGEGSGDEDGDGDPTGTSTSYSSSNQPRRRQTREEGDRNGIYDDDDDDDDDDISNADALSDAALAALETEGHRSQCYWDPSLYLKSHHERQYILENRKRRNVHQSSSASHHAHHQQHIVGVIPIYPQDEGFITSVEFVTLPGFASADPSMRGAGGNNNNDSSQSTNSSNNKDSSPSYDNAERLLFIGTSTGCVIIATLSTGSNHNLPTTQQAAATSQHTQNFLSTFYLRNYASASNRNVCSSSSSSFSNYASLRKNEKVMFNSILCVFKCNDDWCRSGKLPLDKSFLMNDRFKMSFENVDKNNSTPASSASPNENSLNQLLREASVVNSNNSSNRKNSPNTTNHAAGNSFASSSLPFESFVRKFAVSSYTAAVRNNPSAFKAANAFPSSSVQNEFSSAKQGGGGDNNNTMNKNNHLKLQTVECIWVVFSNGLLVPLTRQCLVELCRGIASVKRWWGAEVRINESSARNASQTAATHASPPLPSSTTTTTVAHLPSHRRPRLINFWDPQTTLTPFAFSGISTLDSNYFLTSSSAATQGSHDSNPPNTNRTTLPSAFSQKISTIFSSKSGSTFVSGDNAGATIDSLVFDAGACVRCAADPFRVFKVETHEEQCLVIVGNAPTIATYSLLTDPNHPSLRDSEVSTSKVVAEVASKVASAAFGFIRHSLWNRGGSNDDSRQLQQQTQNNSKDNRNNNENKQRLSIDTPLTLNMVNPFVSLGIGAPPDENVTFTTVDVDPTHRFAACYTPLGRIYIFDLISGVLWRVIKNCRAAECCWIYPTIDGRRTLLLAVHLNFRGCVEFYCLRRKRRAGAVRVGPNCTLFRPDGLSLFENGTVMLLRHVEQKPNDHHDSTDGSHSSDGFSSFTDEESDDDDGDERRGASAPSLSSISTTLTTYPELLTLEVKSKTEQGIGGLRQRLRMLKEAGETQNGDGGGHHDGESRNRQNAHLLSPIEKFELFRQEFEDKIFGPAAKPYSAEKESDDDSDDDDFPRDGEEKEDRELSSLLEQCFLHSDSPLDYLLMAMALPIPLTTRSQVREDNERCEEYSITTDGRGGDDENDSEATTTDMGDGGKGNNRFQHPPPISRALQWPLHRFYHANLVIKEALRTLYQPTPHDDVVITCPPSISPAALLLACDESNGQTVVEEYIRLLLDANPYPLTSSQVYNFLELRILLVKVYAESSGRGSIAMQSEVTQMIRVTASLSSSPPEAQRRQDRKMITNGKDFDGHHIFENTTATGRLDNVKGDSSVSQREKEDADFKRKKKASASALISHQPFYASRLYGENADFDDSTNAARTLALKKLDRGADKSEETSAVSPPPSFGIGGYLASFVGSNGNSSNSRNVTASAALKGEVADVNGNSSSSMIISGAPVSLGFALNQTVGGDSTAIIAMKMNQIWSSQSIFSASTSIQGAPTAVSSFHQPQQNPLKNSVYSSEAIVSATSQLGFKMKPETLSLCTKLLATAASSEDGEHDNTFRSPLSSSPSPPISSPSSPTAVVPFAKIQNSSAESNGNEKGEEKEDNTTGLRQQLPIPSHYASTMSLFDFLLCFWCGSHKIVFVLKPLEAEEEERRGHDNYDSNEKGNSEENVYASSAFRSLDEGHLRASHWYREMKINLANLFYRHTSYPSAVVALSHLGLSSAASSDLFVWWFVHDPTSRDKTAMSTIAGIIKSISVKSLEEVVGSVALFTLPTVKVITAPSRTAAKTKSKGVRRGPQSNANSAVDDDNDNYDQRRDDNFQQFSDDDDDSRDDNFSPLVICIPPVSVETCGSSLDRHQNERRLLFKNALRSACCIRRAFSAHHQSLAAAMTLLVIKSDQLILSSCNSHHQQQQQRHRLLNNHNSSHHPQQLQIGDGKITSGNNRGYAASHPPQQQHPSSTTVGGVSEGLTITNLASRLAIVYGLSASEYGRIESLLSLVAHKQENFSRNKKKENNEINDDEVSPSENNKDSESILANFYQSLIDLAVGSSTHYFPLINCVETNDNRGSKRTSSWKSSTAFRRPLMTLYLQSRLDSLSPSSAALTENKKTSPPPKTDYDSLLKSFLKFSLSEINLQQSHTHALHLDHQQQQHRRRKVSVADWFEGPFIGGIPFSSCLRALRRLRMCMAHSGDAILPPPQPASDNDGNDAATAINLGSNKTSTLRHQNINGNCRNCDDDESGGHNKVFFADPIRNDLLPLSDIALIVNNSVNILNNNNAAVKDYVNVFRERMRYNLSSASSSPSESSSISHFFGTEDGGGNNQSSAAQPQQQPSANTLPRQNTCPPQSLAGLFQQHKLFQSSSRSAKALFVSQCQFEVWLLTQRLLDCVKRAITSVDADYIEVTTKSDRATPATASSKNRTTKRYAFQSNAADLAARTTVDNSNKKRNTPLLILPRFAIRIDAFEEVTDTLLPLLANLNAKLYAAFITFAASSSSSSPSSGGELCSSASPDRTASSSSPSPSSSSSSSSAHSPLIDEDRMNLSSAMLGCLLIPAAVLSAATAILEPLREIVAEANGPCNVVHMDQLQHSLGVVADEEEQGEEQKNREVASTDEGAKATTRKPTPAAAPPPKLLRRPTVRHIHQFVDLSKALVSFLGSSLDLVLTSHGALEGKTPPLTPSSVPMMSVVSMIPRVMRMDFSSTSTAGGSNSADLINRFSRWAMVGAAMESSIGRSFSFYTRDHIVSMHHLVKHCVAVSNNNDNGSSNDDDEEGRDEKEKLADAALSGKRSDAQSSSSLILTNISEVLKLIQFIETLLEIDCGGGGGGGGGSDVGNITPTMTAASDHSSSSSAFSPSLIDGTVEWDHLFSRDSLVFLEVGEHLNSGTHRHEHGGATSSHHSPFIGTLSSNQLFGNRFDFLKMMTDVVISSHLISIAQSHHGMRQRERLGRRMLFDNAHPTGRSATPPPQTQTSNPQHQQLPAMRVANPSLSLTPSVLADFKSNTLSETLGDADVIERLFGSLSMLSREKEEEKEAMRSSLNGLSGQFGNGGASSHHVTHQDDPSQSNHHQRLLRDVKTLCVFASLSKRGLLSDGLADRFWSLSASPQSPPMRAIIGLETMRVWLFNIRLFLKSEIEYYSRRSSGATTLGGGGGGERSTLSSYSQSTITLVASRRRGHYSALLAGFDARTPSRDFEEWLQIAQHCCSCCCDNNSDGHKNNVTGTDFIVSSVHQKRLPISTKGIDGGGGNETIKNVTMMAASLFSTVTGRGQQQKCDQDGKDAGAVCCRTIQSLSAMWLFQILSFISRFSELQELEAKRAEREDGTTTTPASTSASAFLTEYMAEYDAAHQLWRNLIALGSHLVNDIADASLLLPREHSERMFVVGGVSASSNRENEKNCATTGGGVVEFKYDPRAISSALMPLWQEIQKMRF